MEKYGKPQRRSYDGGGVDVVINFTGGDTWVLSLRCPQARRQATRLWRDGRLRPQGSDLRYVPWSFELKITGSNSFYDDNLAALMELIAAAARSSR